jgi:hypothetical protein
MEFEEEKDWFSEKSIILTMMFENGAQKLGEFISGGGETFKMLIGRNDE